MIFSYQLWCLYIVDWFPGVITLQIPFPLDQVLEFVPVMLMGSNGLNFVLFFTLNHIRWWSHEVSAMFFGLDVRCKKGGMENGVNVPLRGKS